MDFAGQVSTFLDLAEATGVHHVTYLSAYGIEQAPPQVAPRAVELDLIGRGELTHSILRPAWFMQNFSETFLKPIDGLITVPTGDGAEDLRRRRRHRRGRRRDTRAPGRPRRCPLRTHRT